VGWKGGTMSQRRPAYRVKKPRISEHSEQVNFFETIRNDYRFNPEFNEGVLFAVPNGVWIGGQNKFALFAKYKAEGFKPGVSDVLYLQPRGEFGYLAIEMKAEDRRGESDAVTPEQTDFLEAVERAGGWGVVCYGCDEAVSVFKTYMELERR
jgi:hypothetical protein